MSETPTNEEQKTSLPRSSEDKDFAREKSKASLRLLGIGVAGALAIGLPATYAVGQETQREASQDALKKIADEKIADQEAYQDSIRKAIDADYDAKSFVAEVHLGEGGPFLGDLSLQAVETYLGDTAYNKEKARIYDALNDSASLQAQQPGDTYDIVKVDGKYIVVTPDHVHKTYPTATELPAVETH